MDQKSSVNEMFDENGLKLNAGIEDRDEFFDHLNLSCPMITTDNVDD